MKVTVGGLLFRVDFHHDSAYEISEDDGCDGVPDVLAHLISRVKGATLCCIHAEGFGGALSYTGAAYCSKTDQFSKETGRRVALTKALQETRFTKLDRAVVWAAYFARAKGVRG